MKTVRIITGIREGAVIHRAIQGRAEGHALKVGDEIEEGEALRVSGCPATAQAYTYEVRTVAEPMRIGGTRIGARLAPAVRVSL